MTEEQLYEGFKKSDSTTIEYVYEFWGPKVLGIAIKNSGEEDDGYDLLQATMIAVWENVEKGKYKHEGKFRQFFFGVAYKIWLKELSARKKRPTVPIDGMAMFLAIPAPILVLGDDEDIDQDEMLTDENPPQKSAVEVGIAEENSPQSVIEKDDEPEKTKKDTQKTEPNKKGNDDDIDIFTLAKDVELAKLHKALKIVAEDCGIKLTLFHIERKPIKEIAKILNMTENYIKKRLCLCRKKLRIIAQNLEKKI